MEQKKDNIHILRRMEAPTAYCYEPYTTQWRMLGQDGTETCYIQASRDESKPEWKRYCYILEKSFYSKLEDENFMRELLAGLPVRESTFWGRIILEV